MPTKREKELVIKIRNDIYVCNLGQHTLVIERARFILRRGGRRLGQWLRYLRGILSTTGERVMICLGLASGEDIESWFGTQNGGETAYVYRLFEHMLTTLGLPRCLAFAHAVLAQNG